MKKRLHRRIISKLIANSKLFKTIAEVISAELRLYKSKNEKYFALEQVASKKISPNKEILSGPFKGMQYPDYVSFGSCLLLKFLGKYERELHPVVEECIKNQYATIVDIGSAEGYYAIGFAMKSVNSSVLAYDTNTNTHSFLRSMALLNDVEDRVEVHSTFTPNEFEPLSKREGKTLIISDCEGYEKQLFTNQTKAFTKHFDILIELHDGKLPGTKESILEALNDTHDAEIIKSKRHDLSCPEISFLDEESKKRVLLERNRIMEWAWLKSKSN